MLVRAIKPHKAPHKMVQAGEVFDMNVAQAAELIRNGLAVEYKMKTPPANKAAPTPLNKADAGKAPAAGEDRPLSALPAAQVSPFPTLTPSADGATRTTLKLRKPRAKRSQ
jgi:hypothetical protein